MRNPATVTAALVLVGALLIPARARANTTESLLAADANGTSSITGTTNWTPTTTVAPTDPLASTYDYTAGFTLRTPPGSGNYTVLANSLTIATSGTLTFKGSGTNTINNLILNGGKISHAGTGATPDAASLAGNINLAASTTITPSTSSGANQYLTILAPITNAVSANITVDGATAAASSGTLVLAAQNTFTGNITVNNRTPAVILQLGVDNALPITTTLQLNGGANSSPVFDLNGYSTTIASLALTGGTTTGIVSNGAPNTTGVLTLGYNDTYPSLSAGTITDNPTSNSVLALTKIGNGTLTLSAAYTYSGDTTVSAGTLKMGASNILPNGPGKGNIIVNGTLDMAGRSETVNGLSGSGTIDNSGGNIGSGYTLTVGNNDTTSTFSGVMQNTLGAGNVALAKMGAGTLYLTSDATFSGNVTIKTGAVWIASSGALGVGPKNVVIQKYTTASGLHLNGTNGNISLPSDISFFTGNSVSPGAIVNEAGNNTINGTISMSTGGSTLVAADAGNLTLAGNIAVATTQSPRNLQLGGAATGAVSGLISDGPDGTNVLSLIKQDAGTWTLTAANTYSGATAINGGTLALGASGSLDNTPSISLASGATLDVSAVTGGWTLGPIQTLSGYGTVVGNITANGKVTVGATIGTFTFANHLTLAGTCLLTINRSNAPADADLISAAALTLGGTLSVTNRGDPLQAGDSFHLLSGSMNGTFTATDLPPLESGLTWDTSQLNSQGIITVQGSSLPPRPSIQPVTVNGTNLSIEFSSSAGFNYYLEAATNVAAPVWIPISTNAGGGTIAISVPINPAEPRQFFRVSSPNP